MRNPRKRMVMRMTKQKMATTRKIEAAQEVHTEGSVMEVLDRRW
jgi:hypothetical protein